MEGLGLFCWQLLTAVTLLVDLPAKGDKSPVKTEGSRTCTVEGVLEWEIRILFPCLAVLQAQSNYQPYRRVE